MGKAVYLNVMDKKVLATKITYEDLIWLYNNFKETYGRLPTTNDGKAKYNMPQQRIIKRVLVENNITFNDFMLQFGKVNHVRTESKDYDLFVDKFKKICNENDKALLQKELTNNKYGLPNVSWFIKYCPDDNVKSYDDFISWCGFESNKLKKDDELVAQKLLQLEKDLGRPINRYDITLENVGFTPIVINRIWGGLIKAKEELGLMETPTNLPLHSFEYYRDLLLEILNRIQKDKHRKFVSWNDIENPIYNEKSTEHKTFTKAFKREGIDMFAFMKENGFEMKPSSIGNTYTFNDGERTKSIYEYDLSLFVKEELHMKYNIDYKRDVMYKTFANIKSKSNCDYVFNIDEKQLYVEVAGIIYNTQSNDWRTAKYKTKLENEYREKMIYKEDLLLKYDKPFLFLFPWDMISGNYKKILVDFIKDNK
jgi:hypothetical protein